MLNSTVFNILLVVGVFLAAKCQAEQPLEDAGLQELQDEKVQDLQDEDLQQLQDEELQELQEEHPDESLRNPDEDPDDNLQESLPSQDENQDDSLREPADEIAQEDPDENQKESNERAVGTRRRVIRYFRGSGTVSCPYSYRYRLSCGIRNFRRSGSYTRRRYAYPYGSRSCKCYAVRGYCSALCTNKPLDTRIVSSLKTTAGLRYLYCPTGYKALGCHGRPYTSSESHASNYPLIYSTSSMYYGRACACYSRYRYRCVVHVLGAATFASMRSATVTEEVG